MLQGVGIYALYSKLLLYVVKLQKQSLSFGGLLDSLGGLLGGGLLDGLGHLLGGSSLGSNGLLDGLLGRGSLLDSLLGGSGLLDSLGHLLGGSLLGGSSLSNGFSSTGYTKRLVTLIILRIKSMSAKSNSHDSRPSNLQKLFLKYLL